MHYRQCVIGKLYLSGQGTVVRQQRADKLPRGFQFDLFLCSRAIAERFDHDAFRFFKHQRYRHDG